MDKLIEKFKEYQKKMHAYSHALNMLYYDSVTSMPKGGSEALGETIGILSEEKYRLESCDEYKGILKELYEKRDELDFITKRETEELFEQQEKITKIPMDEYVQYQIILNTAQSVWHGAKAENDYNMFMPYLKQVIDYQKRYINYIRKDEKESYDVLLNEYEKDLTCCVLDTYFNKIKSELIPLIKETEKCKEADYPFLHAMYPVYKQRKLSSFLMDSMTIDKNHCAIGEAEHPFTLEFSKDDVRITTHYKENDILSNVYSVIHEGGHALYELSIKDELRGSALAHGVSMGIHESQSRFWENIIGRSYEFCEYMLQYLKKLFPDEFSCVSAAELYKGANRAKCNPIRIEADELTYSLHILIRYEIEKMIFMDDVDVKDLPHIWNELYKKYLNIDIKNDTQGILQDSHWSGGSFGYFPSYSIGSAYAAQILYSMGKDLNVFSLVRSGNLDKIKEWLTEKIYQYGALYTPSELIKMTCKEDFDAVYYINYLKTKFTKIYGI